MKDTRGDCVPLSTRLALMQEDVGVGKPNRAVVSIA